LVSRFAVSDFTRSDLTPEKSFAARITQVSYLIADAMLEEREVSG
jgi:hypothetical protein